MSAGWTAASTRGRLLASRCLGATGARRLADTDDLTEALSLLRGTTYGHFLPPDPTIDDARRAVDGTSLWHLRILAGWAPPKGAEPLRALAAPYEISATSEHLAEISGAAGGEDLRGTRMAYEPGGLSISWARTSATTTPSQLQAVLAASSWGDPGGTTCSDVETSMRARWATWLAQSVPEARVWGVAAAAQVAARVVARGGVCADLPADPRRDLVQLLGREAVAARSVADLAAALPTDVGWLLEGATSAEDLWLTEGHWWARVDADAGRMLRGRPGAGVAMGAAARLVVDAWRVNAALEAASWGADGREVFDAVA